MNNLYLIIYCNFNCLKLKEIQSLYENQRYHFDLKNIKILICLDHLILYEDHCDIHLAVINLKNINLNLILLKVSIFNSHLNPMKNKFAI